MPAPLLLSTIQEQPHVEGGGDGEQHTPRPTLPKRVHHMPQRVHVHGHEGRFRALILLVDATYEHARGYGDAAALYVEVMGYHFGLLEKVKNVQIHLGHRVHYVRATKGSFGQDCCFFSQEYFHPDV